MEQSLWTMTLVVTILGTLVMERQHSAMSAVDASPVTPQTRSSVPDTPLPPKSDRVREIVAADLFRRDHQAPDLATTISPRQAAPSQASQKPRLVLQGLVGGPPWDAIVQGVPNHEGSVVVRAGDSVGGLKIRSVRRDAATIRGMDTTWILKLAPMP